MVRTNLVIAAICILLAVGARPVAAQLGPLSDPAQAPQAKTQEEFDEYLSILSQTDARRMIGEVDAFAAAFPGSAFLGIAFQYQMHAFEQLGDFEGMLRAGRKALAANPENLNTLLTLAPALANAAMQRADRDALRAQAQSYANRALAGIEKTHAPRQMPLEEWQAEKRTMQANAHETLGVVALDRADAATAIQEFETAVALQPVPEGAQFLRLGVAYAAGGRVEEAQKSLSRASELGPAVVRNLAMNEMKTLGAGRR